MPNLPLTRITLVMDNMGLSPLQRQAIVAIRDHVKNNAHLVELCREVRELSPYQIDALLRTNPYPGARLEVQQYQKGRDAQSNLQL